MTQEDFRVSWAALVALLRAVGHVLDKVDSAKSPALRRAVDDRWLRWKSNRNENAIFWEFIDSERNNVLKAYTFGYEEEDVQIEHVGPDGSAEVYSNVPFLSPIRSGPFSGQAGLDVARRAITWWTHELDEIEKAARHGDA